MLDDKQVNLANIRGGKFLQSDLESNIKYLIENGYIASDGTPIKCFYCETQEFGEVNEYYNNHSREEYHVECKNCGNIIGLWAYGNWQIQ